jgi:hypothetical protein
MIKPETLSQFFSGIGRFDLGAFAFMLVDRRLFLKRAHVGDKSFDFGLG